MARCVRNRGLIPFYQCEGVVLPQFCYRLKCGCLAPSPYCRSPFCGCNRRRPVDSPFERLHQHQTLASVRRSARFVPFNVRRDALDLALASTYDHERHAFGSIDNVHTQPETLGLLCRYQAKNHIRVVPVCTNIILLGGIKAKGHTSHVGNDIKNPHSDRTKNGYSRNHQGGFFTL